MISLAFGQKAKYWLNNFENQTFDHRIGFTNFLLDNF
jgi:hypothetical protein